MREASRGASPSMGGSYVEELAAVDGGSLFECVGAEECELLLDLGIFDEDGGGGNTVGGNPRGDAARVDRCRSL